MRILKSVIAAATAIGLWSAPAMAANDPVIIAPCDISLTNPEAKSCSGLWDANLNNNASSGYIADIIASLGPTDYVFDGNWAPVDNTKILSLSGVGSNELDFGVTLSGETIFAVHFGASFVKKNFPNQDWSNVTGYWLVDLGNVEVTSIQLNDTQGFSNAVLFSTGGGFTTTGGVPEPGTWMLMLLGFFGIGAVMRRRTTGLVLKAA